MQSIQTVHQRAHIHLTKPKLVAGQPPLHPEHSHGKSEARDGQRFD